MVVYPSGARWPRVSDPSRIEPLAMSAAAANSVILVAIGLVFAVLLAGLVNMVRGGSSNTSQRLMRWRVGLQFLAILVVMTVLYFRG